MDARQFNQLISTLPATRKQVGHMADGTPLYVEVRSLFGDREAAPDET